jgi:rhomboid-like protein
MLPTSTRHWSRILKTTFPRPPSRFLTCTTRNAFRRTTQTSFEKSVPPIPSFKDELVRATDVKLFSQHLKPPSIRNQIIVSAQCDRTALFMPLNFLSSQVFVVGSCLAFSFAATLTNDDTDYWVRKLTGMSLVWKDRLPTNDEILRTRYYDLAKVRTTIYILSKYLSYPDTTSGCKKIWRN